jgi:thioredoxin-related protein
MKLILNTIAAFVAFNMASAQGINFETLKFAEAKAKAAMDNKIIFIDAFTTWCGPCKKLAKDVFPQPEVGSYFNEHFLNLKIDMEKGEGIELAKKYSVNAYPTLLFIDSKGEMVHRTCGLMTKEDLILEATKAVTGKNTIVEAQKNKATINNNPKEALGYFQLMDNACMKLDADVDGFFSALKSSTVVDENMEKIVSSFVNSSNSKGFEYFVNQKPKFIELWGADKFSAFIKSVFINDADRLNPKDKTALTAFEKRVEKYADAENKEYITLISKMKIAEGANDMEAYAISCIAYVEKYAMGDAGQLNNYAWSFYEKVNNPKHLASAEKWAETAVGMSKADWHVLDTYAAVLYKLKKKEQASIEAQKAISLGKRIGEDVSETEALLKKITELP